MFNVYEASRRRRSENIKLFQEIFIEIVVPTVHVHSTKWLNQRVLFEKNLKKMLNFVSSI